MKFSKLRVHVKEDLHLTWFQIALHFLNASCKIYIFIIIFFKNKTISDKNDCLYMVLFLGCHHKSLQGPLHRHPEAGLLSESLFPVAELLGQQARVQALHLRQHLGGGHHLLGTPGHQEKLLLHTLLRRLWSAGVPRTAADRRAQ